MKKSTAKTKVLALVVITTMLLAITACSGGSLDGTWVQKDGGGITYKFTGKNVDIGMTVPGVSYTYKISGDKLIFSVTSGQNTVEYASYNFRREGKSIFIDNIEYVKE